MSRKIIIFIGFALVLLAALNAGAWQPSGWVYHNGDYAYSSNDGAWYYFSRADTQWRVNLRTGIWGELADTPSGWNYYNWPYAYSSATASWYWYNAGDEQWCCKLGIGVWTIFGISSSNTGIAQFVGYWSGTYSGDERGTWSCTVDTSGVVSGTTFAPDGDYDLVGTVTTEGSMTATAGNVATGASFDGQMTPAGTVDGTWDNPWYRMDGTFTGNRR